ncbi:hypothetical protein AVEN_72363-1 [Araneus ventricosus]|uniref:Uncharacterized protein n=1 Tax=Araneus ventricosus TaxID=182803 RepID=A0A4Y2JI39_ARAVE|nr:hypothetical protein AVEN_244089-1 [Araneus ventricosus]GBM89016.1 hypothetical protein AVEN_72363-1 [Araneus ventricosus]
MKAFSVLPSSTRNYSNYFRAAREENRILRWARLRSIIKNASRKAPRTSSRRDSPAMRDAGSCSIPRPWALREFPPLLCYSSANTKGMITTSENPLTAFQSNFRRNVDFPRQILMLLIG